MAMRQRVPAGFWRHLGPGLMWAAVAIGVSHLVQSTRAGAMAGFGLAGVIVLALVLKYPFFEFGSRYAVATGESLVEGYRRIGRWALWLYFLLTVVTGLIHQAALIMFTAVLLQNVLQLGLSVVAVAAVLYASCGVLLWTGRFRVFDRTVKVILVLLTLSTLGAAAMVLPDADFSTLALWPAVGAEAGVPLAFILALVGFMPSAIEVSVMSSLWTLAKERETAHRASLAAMRLDFNVGYVGTGIVAFAFLLLGSELMFGSGRQFSAAGPVFATQLVDLYGTTLGPWSRPLVSIAVLTTMLSTALIVIDGFPRALDRCIDNLWPAGPEPDPRAPVGRAYWTAMALLGISTVALLGWFGGSLTAMIDFATIFTFITAPILGYLNLRAVTSPHVPPEHHPGRVLRSVAVAGLVMLVGLGLFYLVGRV